VRAGQAETTSSTSAVADEVVNTAGMGMPLTSWGRSDRRVAGVPAQVEEELPVRILLGDLVGPVHGQRGLAENEPPASALSPESSALMQPWSDTGSHRGMRTEEIT
jgi:hypothetical protein